MKHTQQQRRVIRLAGITLLVLLFGCETGNNATVAGVDADADGMRDDVQRYIDTTFPNSEPTRLALGQYAEIVQAALIDAANPTAARTHGREQLRALECLYAVRPTDARNVRTMLLAEILNTTPRNRAYLLYNDQLSGQSFAATPLAELASGCDFSL